MLSRRKPTEASIRAADRRGREDAAQRLIDLIPSLATLELAIEERRGGAPMGDSRYVRRIVTERAPAMFDLPCADKDCMGGGHDVTSQVMSALRTSARRFEGEHVCDGTVRSVPCGRTLRYIGSATYKV